MTPRFFASPAIVDFLEKRVTFRMARRVARETNRKSLILSLIFSGSLRAILQGGMVTLAKWVNPSWRAKDIPGLQAKIHR